MPTLVPEMELVEYLGIDPGVSGGLVAILPDGKIVSTKMLETEWAILDWLTPHDNEGHIRRVAVIEKVQGWIGGAKKKDGKEAESQGQPGSAMFTFGQSYGTLRMALVATGLLEGADWWAVPPMTWQRGLGIEAIEGESRPDHKKRLKAIAQNLYQDLKVTGWMADALLMATYCMLKHRGEV